MSSICLPANALNPYIELSSHLISILGLQVRSKGASSSPFALIRAVEERLFFRDEFAFFVVKLEIRSYSFRDCYSLFVVLKVPSFFGFVEGAFFFELGWSKDISV